MPGAHSMILALENSTPDSPEISPFGHLWFIADFVHWVPCSSFVKIVPRLWRLFLVYEDYTCVCKPSLFSLGWVTLDRCSVTTQKLIYRTPHYIRCYHPSRGHCSAWRRVVKLIMAIFHNKFLCFVITLVYSHQYVVIQFVFYYIRFSKS